ncbi:MAG TPA: signal peptidase I [Firmicutes bacterium]|nr:signal peptidase I [Bacillota bacterium]
MAKMKHAGNRNTLYDNYTASKHSQGVVSAYEWVGEILAAVVVVVLIFTFLFRVVTVSGTSMYPNYHDGDRLIVTNTFGQPLEQGDVVVLVNVLEEPIIKRVIATENQTVDIDFPTGTVYVDGEPLDESQFGLPNGITTQTAATLERTQFPATVPEGHIFVLGDNRPVSEDSRYTDVGMVDVRNVLGKAEFRLFPFDRIGLVE